MLNANDVLEDLKKQVLESEELPPQEVVEEAVTQESLVEPEVVEEELPEELPKDKGNEAWVNMRKAQKKAKDNLKAEKEAREQSDKQVQELRERLARLEGRDEVRARNPEPEVIEDPEPDKMLDPEAWKEWKIAKQDKAIAELHAKVEKTTTLTEIEGTRRGMARIENDYKTTAPDYEDRINFMMNAEKQRIKLLYPTANETQIDNHLEKEKFRMANEALGQGRNPAEVFYKMAETYGYQAKKSEPKGAKPDMEAIKRNMEKNVNLIGSSGAEKAGGITSEQLFRSTLGSLVNKQGDIAKLIKQRALEEN